MAPAQHSVRIVVYPPPRKDAGPLIFPSRETLLQQLRAVIPRFNEDRILAVEPKSSQIVYAESLELSESQLAQLCLAH
jgi:hypothetical protein